MLSFSVFPEILFALGQGTSFQVQCELLILQIDFQGRQKDVKYPISLEHVEGGSLSRPFLSSGHHV